MKKIILIVILFFGCFFISLSQTEEVNKYLRLVAYGKIDEVRAVIPDLLAKYPNDAGVKLLHGTILDDAFLAINVYKSIIKEFPESQWADHAYWRIVQFYAVIGDTTKAKAELDNFRIRYPSSSFLTPASDVVRSAVSLSRKNLKNTTLIAENTSNTKPQIVQKPLNSDQAKVEQKLVTSNTEIINPDKLAETTDLSKNKTVTSGKTSATLITAVKKPEPEHSEKQVPTTTMPVSTSKPQVENKSLAKVEIAEKPKNDEPEFYGLQVGIYKDKNSAETEKNKFLIKRLRTQVVEKTINNVIMFAVVIGHYSSVESAEEGKKIVSIQCGCEPVIYKK